MYIKEIDYYKQSNNNWDNTEYILGQKSPISYKSSFKGLLHPKMKMYH